MPKLLFSHVEEHMKRLGVVSLEHLEYLYGVRLTMYLPTKDVRSRVYGKEHNRGVGEAIEITGVLISDDMLPIGPGEAGTFEQGFLFTKHKDVKVGSTLEVKRRDGRGRRYKVDSREAVGTTDEVFVQWAVSSLGGEE